MPDPPMHLRWHGIYGILHGGGKPRRCSRGVGLATRGAFTRCFCIRYVENVASKSVWIEPSILSAIEYEWRAPPKVSQYEKRGNTVPIFISSFTSDKWGLNGGQWTVLEARCSSMALRAAEILGEMSALLLSRHSASFPWLTVHVKIQRGNLASLVLEGHVEMQFAGPMVLQRKHHSRICRLRHYEVCSS